MQFIGRCTAIVTFLMVSAVSGMAGQFSFTGNFVNDNDVQLFSFTLLSPGAVTLQTWGYGGGTNAAGQVIAPGGFESVLAIFQAPSGIAFSGPIDLVAPPCAPRNVDPTLLPATLCLDVYSQFSLPAGDYFLSLTQFGNEPIGNLSDGFPFTDVADLVNPTFNDHFVGTNGYQRDSHWAVDISSVDAASQIGGATPEPASAALVAGAVVLAGFWRRRLTKF
jgi:hypothetical protein